MRKIVAYVLFCIMICTTACGKAETKTQVNNNPNIDDDKLTIKSQGADESEAVIDADLNIGAGLEVGEFEESDLYSGSIATLDAASDIGIKSYEDEK